MSYINKRIKLEEQFFGNHFVATLYYTDKKFSHVTIDFKNNIGGNILGLEFSKSTKNRLDELIKILEEVKKEIS